MSGSSDIYLVQVRVRQWLGKLKVVGRVEGVSSVQEKEDVAAVPDEPAELVLEPGHRVVVGDVEQGHHGNVLLLQTD